MKRHNLDPDAQMRLLEEIYGEKAIVSAVERNRENREIEIQNALRRLSEQQREMILYQYGFADGCPTRRRKPRSTLTFPGRTRSASRRLPCGRCAAPPALAGCGYCCRSFESEEENFLDLTWVFPKALLS